MAKDRVERLKSAEFIERDNKHPGQPYDKLLNYDVQWNHPLGGKQRFSTGVKDYNEVVVRKLNISKRNGGLRKVVAVFYWTRKHGTVCIEVFPYGSSGKSEKELQVFGPRLMELCFFPNMDLKYRIPKFFQLKERTKVSRLADIVQGQLS